MKLRTKTELSRRLAAGFPAAGFTLIELLVAMALMAVVIPVIVSGLRLATLAGEVSQRKALASRIADRVLGEAIINGPVQSPQSGNEAAGPFQFHWTMKDEPWSQLGGLTTVNNPNGINQGVVTQNLIHQLSVDVTYVAQGKNLSVHLATLYNTTPTQ